MATEVEQALKSLKRLREMLDSATKPVRVLVVEDDPTEAKLIHCMLEDYHVIVADAWRASPAVELLRHNQFTVAIIDLKLAAGESGIDVVREIAVNHPQTIPVVLTGANEDSPEIKRALNEGAKFVLQKPLTWEHVKVLFGTL